MDLKIPIATLTLLALVAMPAIVVDDSDPDGLRLEAEAGNREALFRYGVCLYEGDGVPRDERKALQMWADAARLGHAPSAATLALTLRSRTDDPAALEEGQYWIVRAADLGHPDAMLTLSGEALERGDLVEAAVWGRLADHGSGRWTDRVAAIECRLEPAARLEVDRRCGEWMATHQTVGLGD